MSGECEKCSEHVVECGCNVTEESFYVIREAECTIRTYNILKNNNLLNVKSLEKMYCAEVLAIKNCGRKSLNEIRLILSLHGTCLKDDIILTAEEEKKFVRSIPDFVENIRTEIREIRKSIDHLLVDLEKIKEAHTQKND